MTQKPPPKPPEAKTATATARPRAQVSYEGDDEFSMMSLDPSRKKQLKDQQRLKPSAPGEKQRVKVDQLKPVNDNGIVGLFRKIFPK